MDWMNKANKLVMLLVLAPLLSGCVGGTIAERLHWADDQAGKLLSGLGQATSTPAASSSEMNLPDLDDFRNLTQGIREKLAGGENAATTSADKSAGEVFPVITGAADLTRDMKDRIDVWLEVNGYNRYGDQKDTYYTGGTPLFDESTGESIDRYDYILEKHPDILSKI